MVEDITERKAAEAALRESEERLQKLTDAAFEGIIIHDGGEILAANKAYAAMHGCEIGEIVGRSALEWAAPEYRDLVRQHILSGHEEPYESAAIKKDGTRIDVEVRGRALTYQGRAVRVAAVRDVTERKRAEDALEESEERYRAVVEQSAEAIWLFDPETKRVLEANAAFQKMLGYGAEELRGMTNYDFVAHSREDVDRAVADKLREGQATRRERKYRTKDGRLLDVEVGGTKISYRGKEVVCSAARDITERKRIEEEIRETNRRLGELATLKADFTAMVAHELDTPLAVIRGYADVLATGELGPAESERALSQIQSETEVLNALVEDVRIAASAERKDFAVVPRKVPVDELLDAAARFVLTLPGDHPLILQHATDEARWDGVRAGYADPFIFGGTDSGPQVWADRYRIGQVLRNLLANAVKYSPEGTPIELRAVPDEAVGRVRIEVVDHGPGIHPDDMERIFEKFGRGRDPEGRKVSGLGLGLYLSRRILQAHGSDLQVNTAPDGGSVFSFDLESD
jgi:PAS domain S-box-containing protein